MKIIIGKEIVFALAKMIGELLVKFFFYFKDGALIRNSMNMRNGMFITGFGHQYSARVRIKRIAENIKQEIPFANKAHAKGIGIFRIGGIAISATAPEIEYTIKIGLV